MAIEEPRRSPRNQTRSPRPNDNGGENILSPRFRSVAAMAGWDEETLLMASFIVDDTPDRERKNRKHQNSKTPPSNSRRKRKQQGAKNSPIPATILKLDDDDDEEDTPRNKEKKTETQNGKEESKTLNISAASLIPCMDKLREELSCAICLDICFEPSTTPCGHSFCKKCLKSAADKCGKRCPKCRQLIGNGRSCTVNTVLWNTIQLLFPNEIEARKLHSSAEKQPNRQDRDRITYSSNSHSQTRPQPTAIARRRRNRDSSRTQSSVPSQDEDAALALRLQREEFLQVVRVERGSSSSSNGDNSRISISLARENLRAMASRAINVRIRNRAT